MESAAVSVLKRAVEMDMKEQFTMALVLYQEGVQILLDTVKAQESIIKRCRDKGSLQGGVSHVQSQGVSGQSREGEKTNYCEEIGRHIQGID